MKGIAREVALAALEIGALKLQPHNPFTWTSGYRMPIYNDNRLLMGNYKSRLLVAAGFRELIEASGITPDLIAGVATGGIAPATTLANEMKLPLVYVREKAKAHGVGRQVEGLYHSGERAVLIEDLISTGKSSAAALVGLRETGVLVDDCFAIFSYDFPEAKEAFSKLGARMNALLTFPQLLEVAAEAGKITSSEKEMLRSWSEAPLEWGEKHGFPKVQKD